MKTINNKPLSAGAIKRARSTGRGMAPHINPALIVMSKEQIEGEFKRINSVAHTNAEAVEMRRAALDFVIESSNQGSGWAKFYTSIEFVKQNEWYWRDAGYDTFEDFWAENGGKAFADFAELERTYNIAKTACPDMFNMDASEALATYRRISAQADKLRRVAPMKSPGGVINNKNAIKAGAAKHFDTPQDAIERIEDAATYKAASGGSVERRFARIRRDSPEVAADLLAGKYIKQLKSGVYEIDLTTAEELVYGKKDSRLVAKDKNQANTPQNVAKMIKRVLKKHDIAEIIAAINTIPGIKARKTNANGV